MICSYASGIKEFFVKITKLKLGMNLLFNLDFEDKTRSTHNLLDSIAIPNGNKHSKRVNYISYLILIYLKLL